LPRIENLAEKTTIVEYEEFKVMDEVLAVMVRTETLFLAARSGGSEPLAKEGTKVRRGMRIYNINESVSASEGAEEKRFGTILETAGDGAQMSEGGVVPVTAIVSYYADGYEKRITPENVSELTKDLAEKLPNKSKSLKRDTVLQGEPVYKLTNNNVWYMAYWIPKNGVNVENYEIGVKVMVDLGTTRVTATVTTVDDAGKDKFIVLKSDMYYKDLPKYRKQDIKVIFEEYEGPIVPDSAVVMEHGMNGVYVKQQNGTFAWVPVNVIKENDGRSFVNEGKFYDEDGLEVVTIKYYDEILIDPKSEGY
jgi:putative membrane fusion protein